MSQPKREKQLSVVVFEVGGDGKDRAVVATADPTIVKCVLDGIAALVASGSEAVDLGKLSPRTATPEETRTAIEAIRRGRVASPSNAPASAVDSKEKPQ